MSANTEQQTQQVLRLVGRQGQMILGSPAIGLFFSWVWAVREDKSINHFFWQPVFDLITNFEAE